MTQPMSSTTPKFFGLTALGAPDPFHNNLVDTVMIDIFTDDDLTSAFRKSCWDDDRVFVPDFLKALYRGEFPHPEMEKLFDALAERGVNARDGDAVGEAMLVEAVGLLRDISQQQISDSVYGVGAASEYSSSALMRGHRFKHQRLKDHPGDKYAEPVTTSMAVGWKAPPELDDRALGKSYHPKKSCAETQYQDALVKTGMTYR
mmetsp:Transcript_1374/g.2323  ORF Transcript_1374/g.2323 Transcript_1374/m.2323 type:complete len:203 (-) Transcript_1374:167-775(-)